MSDRIETMKKEIKIATAFAIAIYFLALVYLLFPEWVIKNISQLNVLPIGTLFLGIGTYLVIGDIHNWLDKTFFGERKKVDTYILERITKPCIDAQCLRAIKNGILEVEKRNLMNVFFMPELIGADDTERERAFSYFTEYFIAVNLSAVSFVGIIGAIIIASVIPLSSSEQRIVFFLIAFMLPILSNGLRYRTKRKLSYPAEAQTARILTTKLDILKNLLPSYRVYENGVSCKGSERCPLSSRRV